jgi:hypothetical protein
MGCLFAKPPENREWVLEGDDGKEAHESLMAEHLIASSNTNPLVSTVNGMKDDRMGNDCKNEDNINNDNIDTASIDRISSNVDESVALEEQADREELREYQQLKLQALALEANLTIFQHAQSTTTEDKVHTMVLTTGDERSSSSVASKVEEVPVLLTSDTGADQTLDSSEMKMLAADQSSATTASEQSSRLVAADVPADSFQTSNIKYNAGNNKKKHGKKK